MIIHHDQVGFISVMQIKIQKSVLVIKITNRMKEK